MEKIRVNENKTQPCNCNYIESWRALTTKKSLKLSKSWLHARYLGAEFDNHCDVLFRERTQRKKCTSVPKTPALSWASCPKVVCCITASQSIPLHLCSRGFYWCFALFLSPLSDSVLNLLRWFYRLWTWSKSFFLLVQVFCARGTRGFHASLVLPLPVRTLEVWIPETTTFAHLAQCNGRKKFVVLLPWRLMLAMKGNSWIWMLVCLLIYLLLCSAVGKYFHLSPCLVKNTLFITAGSRVQNWTAIISPCPGPLLVLSGMLRGWQKTHEEFLRKKWPPSFCKATPTSSFLLLPWDASSLPRDAGVPHTVDGAASACLAPLSGEGMPCHFSCSSCLLLYPVCELLTLIAPSPARAPLPLPSSKTVSCFLESGSMRASCWLV